MEGWAALITAIAALVSALAWPAAAVAALIAFSRQIGAASKRLPTLMGQLEQFSIGPLEFKLRALQTALSTDAADLVDEAMNAPGEISTKQIQSAARVKASAATLGDKVLREQLQRLCVEYETVRRLLPSSPQRTRAMVDVLVRLRTLAPSVSPFLEELKASASPGERLAAVAIMQVDPDRADLPWIIGRFQVDEPFIFFQAATVLRNLANLHAGTDPEVVRAAEQALAIVRGFGGAPDSHTIMLLESLATGAPA